MQEPAPLRVLLVNDEPAIQRTLRALLSRDHHGLALVSAASISEGQQALAGQRFDVLVADYLLPDGNGADLISWAARREPSIASVLWTGLHGLPELVQLARRESAVVVGKPALAHELVAAIRAAVALKKATA